MITFNFDFCQVGDRDRRVLWLEVIALTDQGFPSIVASDFNCIDGLDEKRGEVAVHGGHRVKEVWRVPTL